MVSSKVESESTEWTDEKHDSFLNSIEASFVDKLCTHRYHSEELVDWFSRWKKIGNSSSLHINDLSINKFKVQRQGRWNILRCENYSPVRNESLPLATNQWIKRLIPKSKRKEACRKSSNAFHADGFIKSSSQPENEGNEASDQNFVDSDLEEMEQEQPSRKSKERSQTTCIPPVVLPVNNQVVAVQNETAKPTYNENPELSEEDRETDCTLCLFR